MSDITLSSGIRQNLLALQNTSNDLNTTQEQLATGKKVNTAFDNPTSYFTSQSLTNRSNDLSALLDQIGQAQQTLNAANDGLTGLTSLLEQALSTAQQAQQATTGTVTYSGTQTGSAIAADTTQAVSTSTFAAAVTASTPSVQSESDFKSAGFAQLTTGDTLTYTLAGSTVTATFGASTDTTTNTFSNAAGLISVLNTGTGASGNLSSVALVQSDGSGGVQVIGNDLTHNITTTATSGSLSAGNFTSNTSLATTGDGLAISDGEGHSSTFYYVAHNAVAASDTFTSSANLISAISGSNLSSTITATAPTSGANNGKLVLSSPDGAISIGGTFGSSDLGYTSTYKNNYNSTLAGLTSGSTLTVQVGTDAVSTLTFGSGNGQISTLAELNTSLAALGDISASVNSQNKIVLTPTSSNIITLGGTAATVTSLGFSAGTVTPTATVVTPSSTRATLQSNYNALLTQIDQLAGDSSYNGVNLLNSNNLTVNFNENGTSGLTIAGVNFSSSGLGLSAISGNGFQDNTNITSTEDAINAAITNVRAQTETFGTNSSTISTRQTFETNLINTLQTGASNLVLADQNQASANLLTEQTQQQLEISALSIANEANQSVLKLFG
jgi:flagellin-like hook-associated protein FlgL